MVRVVIAGIVAGLAVFSAGAFNHMVLGLEGRAMKRVPDDAAFREYLSKKTLPSGLYSFPEMAEGFEKMSQEEQQKEWDRANEEYKRGPAGLLLIAPTGEDMMGPRQLVLEALTNIGAALIASWIVSLAAAGTPLLLRWLIVFSMGLFAWLSVSASFAIWYRFPWPYVLDSLFGAMIEWAVAGLLVALIVRSGSAARPA